MKDNTLNFKRITEKDFPKIDEYFSRYLSYMGDERLCDYAPGTVKMWCSEYFMEYAELDGTLYLKADYGEKEGTSYLMPVGRQDESSLGALFEYVKDKERVTLSVIPERLKSLVSEVFGVDKERLFYDRDWVDYVYLREEFENPSGKKHHNYKYNLNRFAKDHPSYRVEKISGDNKGAAIEFYKEYCKNNRDTSSDSEGEYRATLPVIEDLQKYSMTGAVLFAEDRIVGLTIGEIYGDTVIIHTEKAEKSVPGAFQTIAREFIRLLPDGVKYVNREEDMGLEGLRRSKLSYAPISLERKYTLYLK